MCTCEDLSKAPLLAGETEVVASSVFPTALDPRLVSFLLCGFECLLEVLAAGDGTRGPDLDLGGNVLRCVRQCAAQFSVPRLRASRVDRDKFAQCIRDCLRKGPLAAQPAIDDVKLLRCIRDCLDAELDRNQGSSKLVLLGRIAVCVVECVFTKGAAITNNKFPDPDKVRAIWLRCIGECAPQLGSDLSVSSDTGKLFVRCLIACLQRDLQASAVVQQALLECLTKCFDKSFGVSTTNVGGLDISDTLLFFACALKCLPTELDVAMDDRANRNLALCIEDCFKKKRATRRSIEEGQELARCIAECFAKSLAPRTIFPDQLAGLIGCLLKCYAETFLRSQVAGEAGLGSPEVQAGGCQVTVTFVRARFSDSNADLFAPPLDKNFFKVSVIIDNQLTQARGRFGRSGEDNELLSPQLIGFPYVTRLECGGSFLLETASKVVFQYGNDNGDSGLMSLDLGPFRCPKEVGETSRMVDVPIVLNREPFTNGERVIVTLKVTTRCRG